MRRLGAVAVVALVATAALAPSGAFGAGKTYTLVQCDPLHRGGGETVFDPSVPYDSRSLCSVPQQDNAIKIDNVARAQPQNRGRAYWQAPPSTSIVEAVAEVKMRNDQGHRSHLYTADDRGRETFRIANGDGSPTAWQRERWKAGGAGQQRFVASLSCRLTSGCAPSDLAKTWMREVRITLADRADPEFSDLSGSLFGGGWLRGEHAVETEAGDRGSGLDGITLTVNGGRVTETMVRCPGRIDGTSLTKRLVPCQATGALAKETDTRAAPFQDGSNAVQICAEDFARNTSCVARTVHIDNAPPQAHFSNGQNPEDPELIRAIATDPHSGVAAGAISYRAVGSSFWKGLPTARGADELTARVDSSAEPPGTYEFRVEASDVAGNEAMSTQRADGSPMRLEFPLRSGVELTAALEPGSSARQVLAYGRSSEVAGRLHSAAGEPLPNQEVVVTEHFGDGALISRRVRTVTTGIGGRWSSPLPAGPSRRVSAYFAGTPRYLESTDPAGRMLVRSRASFKTSRPRVPEGRRIVFRGRVGHLGARIPAGGKLVELQVRERPRRWNTVREAFYTNGAGRYRIAYRFGRFYVSNARFRFRVKVTREQGWPFRAPVSTRARRVTVLAR